MVLPRDHIVFGRILVLVVQLIDLTVSMGWTAYRVDMHTALKLQHKPGLICA